MPADGAHPSIPVSKENCGTTGVGAGLTVTVRVASLERRKKESRTTYAAVALPENPAVGVNVTMPLSAAENVPPVTAIVVWRPAADGSRSRVRGTIELQ